MAAVLLDPSIRIWVFIPIFILVILASLLRQFIMQGMTNQTPPNANKSANVKYNQLISWSRTTLSSAAVLSPASLAQRRRLFTAEGHGKLLIDPPAAANPLQTMMEMSDPSQMGSQFGLLAINGGLAYLISYLFSGFLVAKSPFPLTYKFKNILQRGIDVPNLDVTYVSSVSWYFLVLFCGTSFLYIINFWIFSGKGSKEIDTDQLIMSMAMPLMAGQNAGPSTDLGPQLKHELESWNVHSPVTMLRGIESAALQALTKA